MTRIAMESVAGTVAELLAEGVHRLRAALGSDVNGTPELDAELLLAAALRAPRAQLRSHPEERPAAEAVRRFAQLLARRAAGEPVAYLLGRKGFWTLELAVSPAVLVPRPETELLIERALALGPSVHGRAADLGTGSGAIALALAAERPAWQIVATDVSAQALEVARDNAAAAGLERIDFREGSWCEALPAGAFDLLVSNPPYIGANDPALAALGHEPLLALTPGPDALACLREIIRCAPRHLAPGGWLLLEHGAAQGPSVAGELVQRGFVTVRTHRDLAGRERMTEGQWPAIR
jgi:release factor glutamine methyltransferase